MNLNQVTIPATNLSKSIPFYEELGLKLIVHTHEDYARFVCPDGGSSFSLHRVDELLKGNGTWIYFEIEELDNYCLELKKKGIEFLQEPKDQSWLWREAHLNDPDGNRIILYYAGENRLNPPWKI